MSMCIVYVFICMCVCMGVCEVIPYRINTELNMTFSFKFVILDQVAGFRTFWLGCYYRLVTNSASDNAFSKSYSLVLLCTNLDTFAITRYQMTKLF